MPDLPIVPAQDFFVGLGSAGLMLWLLLTLARSGGQPEPRAAEIFASARIDRRTNRFSFLGGLFLHLFLLSLAPWLELLFPGALPMDFRRYDLVIVQFKTAEPALKLPPDVARMLKPAEPPSPDALAYPGPENDPGRGDGREAPANERDPGGDGESRRPGPEPRRFEIVVPERPRPKTPALAELAEAALELPAISPTPDLRLAMEFQAPDPSSLRRPGTPALADLELAEAPALPVTPGANGWADLLAEGDAGARNALLLGDALRGTALGGLFGGSPAGRGRGDGFGDGAGAGVSGGGGEGFGPGSGGRAPVPRKLHGIIVISNDASTIPEAADVLTGNPVYTVYMDVPGFAKKWILQVCVPADAARDLEYEPGVVRVMPRKRLDPPFAAHKPPLRLNLDGLAAGDLPPRIVVYATVDARGELGNLRVVAGLNDDTDNLVLAGLRDWNFQPAFRDGEPVAVEALFGIPLR